MRRAPLFLLLIFASILVGFLTWRLKAPLRKENPIILKEPGAETMEFIFVGDSGSGLPEQFQLADALERELCFCWETTSIPWVCDPSMILSGKPNSAMPMKSPA
jgi:hypothetical protein